MFIVDKQIEALSKLIPFASLKDEITIDGDVSFVEKLIATVSLQRKIAKGLGMNIQEIDPNEYDGSLISINSLINAINENFMKIAKAIESGDINFNNFDENVKINLFFNDFNRTVTIDVVNDGLTLTAGDLQFKYNAATNTFIEEQQDES